MGEDVTVQIQRWGGLRPILREMQIDAVWATQLAPPSLATQLGSQGRRRIKQPIFIALGGSPTSVNPKPSASVARTAWHSSFTTAAVACAPPCAPWMDSRIKSCEIA
jgi:hypothetical protein